jgi:hypothetical protein
MRGRRRGGRVVAAGGAGDCWDVGAVAVGRSRLLGVRRDERERKREREREREWEREREREREKRERERERTEIRCDWVTYVHDYKKIRIAFARNNKKRFKVTRSSLIFITWEWYGVWIMD